MCCLRRYTSARLSASPRSGEAARSLSRRPGRRQVNAGKDRSRPVPYISRQITVHTVGATVRLPMNYWWSRGASNMYIFSFSPHPLFSFDLLYKNVPVYHYPLKPGRETGYEIIELFLFIHCANSLWYQALIIKKQELV